MKESSKITSEEKTQEIHALLSDLFESDDPSVYDPWLKTSNRALGYKTPQSLIDEGRVDEVIVFLKRLIHGVCI